MVGEQVERQRLKWWHWTAVFLCIIVVATILPFIFCPSPFHRLWQTHQLEFRTGVPLTRWPQRPDKPSVFALSPDASLLAVGFDDGKIVLWRIQ